MRPSTFQGGMQAVSSGGGGGGGRRRQALQLGDVLPCHLLQQPDSPGDPGDSTQEGGVDHNLPDKPSSDAPLAGATAAAPAPPAVAAQALAAPAALGSPAAATEPLPAYTSLARQQLQQRLKAAIAAGTGTAAAAAAAAAAAPATAQQPSSLLGPSAVQQQRQKSRAGQLQGCGSKAGTALLPRLESRRAAQQLSAATPLVHAQPPVVSARAPAAADEFQLLLPDRPCQASTAALSSVQPPPQHGVQRGPLALLLPPLTDQFTGVPRLAQI